MITSPRFSSAHTNPIFRRAPKRVSKVTIDSRFPEVLTDKASAPVDKRGKQQDDDNKKQKRKEDSDEESGDDDSDGEQELMSSDESAVCEEQSNEDVSQEDDEPETVEEEEIANIEKETHRLAIVNMDWKHVTATDLYVVLNSFLKKDGRVLSVAVYPTEFGLERMKHEDMHGPATDVEEDNSDEEKEDEDVINERIREYELSKFKYYFAVAECDTSSTADSLYTSFDGFEFGRSSNKFDLRFIPDSTEFNHPPRDVATEAPANYQSLDFQSQALQMTKVNISWDEDEPHRVKTLNQKFNPDQLANLDELKEYLAPDDSDSDDDDDEKKKETIKETYRRLMESEDVDSDKDEEEEENDVDMKFTFIPDLEDVSKKIIKEKNKKSETLWDTQLREKREKNRGRRMKQKDDDNNNKKKKGLEEKVAAEGRSIAELELIGADENGGDGSLGLKGYNIKRKSREMAEDKIPWADPDDTRFAAAISDHNYALDPTNPKFKRSATYVKQLAQKQKEDPTSQEQVEAMEKKEEESTRDGMLGTKKRSFTESAIVKSVKLKIQQKKAELAQRMKKKAKAN